MSRFHLCSLYVNLDIKTQENSLSYLKEIKRLPLNLHDMNIIMVLSGSRLKLTQLLPSYQCFAMLHNLINILRKKYTKIVCNKF
jgi:hypothetical protein